MRALWMALLIASLLGATACYSSIEGRPRSDGGPIGVDAGLRDAGTFFDAGRGMDAGSFPDAGTFDAGPRFPDAGPGFPDAGDLVCELGEVIRYVGPGCQMDTLLCLERCRDGECQSRCVERDPDCALCINTKLIQCANETRCQEPWNRFACCTSETCPLTGVERLACDPDGCFDEAEVVTECINDQVERCQMALFECF